MVVAQSQRGTGIEPESAWPGGLDVILRLASSGDDRALAIRDHILPLLREYGALEVQRDTVRVVELRIGAWTFRHWTPFNDLAPGEASSPGYRHAVEKQHTKPDLPYGLDVYHGGQVLSVLWADDGAMEVATFIRGPGKRRRWRCDGSDSSVAHSLQSGTVLR
jgi:hypothetical protein